MIEDFNPASCETRVNNEAIKNREDRISTEEIISEIGCTDDNEGTNGEAEEVVLQDAEPQDGEGVQEENIEEAVRHQHKYNLRPNRTLNYMHKFAFLSVHARARKWGERAKEAVKDELKMLNKEEVFVEIKQPTKMQKDKALMIQCFVREKRDGRIKARVWLQMLEANKDIQKKRHIFPQLS